jgi:predicted O-methyltransferase YrrM
MLVEPIEHYWQDPMFEEDWFSYHNLYRWVVGRSGSGSHFVEVGSWKGRSAAFMGVEIHNSGKTIRFDCVDTWKGSETEDAHQNDQYVKTGTLYDKFIQNTERLRHILKPVVGLSVEVSKQYADDSLDFVFIDGDHRYECVLADIRAWLPKVKAGGVIAGHDYGWWPDVRRAVHEVFGEPDGKCEYSYGVGCSSYDDRRSEGCWVVEVGWK